jgi:carboxyl-terminal processing protease
VTRAALFFVVCLFLLPGAFWARPACAATALGFDSATAASVWSAALAYIAPRSLAPLTIPQMTLWGLNGLAGLDPNLDTTLQGGQIRLYGPDSMLLAVPAPAPNDANGWGQAAAQVAQAAYTASPALQTAGTQGIIDNFFDELFNHFDPYSRYEPPQQAALDQLMIMGLAGTGLMLGEKGGHVVVSAVAADSPAENAGIVPGTLVLSMNGARAYPSQLTALNNGMNGIQGSTVSFSLLDPTDPAAPASPQDVTLTRGFIPPQTVFTESDIAPGVAVLKITGFNKGTGDQFSSAIAALMASNPGPTGLVLDLRGNRGGILTQAVLVADSLLPGGIIAQAEGRDPNADQLFKAEGSDLTSGTRLVVLVDGQTASAAEILSAALADNGRAVVVGSETLGKGLVQTITALPDGGELFVTWSRVLAPRSWPLQSLGVMPQICTSTGPAALQSQLTALAQGKNLMAPALASARAIRAPVEVDVILSVRDHCPAALGGDLDITAAAALFQNPAAYRAALLQ